MSGWARPGIQCVCVDATWHPFRASPLVEGATYTIERVGSVAAPDWSDVSLEGAVTIGLVEVENPDHHDGMFASTRFRPLVDQQQDVELFEHHLTPAPVLEPAA